MVDTGSRHVAQGGTGEQRLDLLSMGSEDLPPGSRIPVHRHEVDEEIIIVHRGRLEVTLGDRTAVAGERAVIFIPVGTWIGLTNIGPDMTTIIFVFPRGSVEQCFQHLGRGEGESERRMEKTEEEARRERMVCQMIYR